MIETNSDITFVPGDRVECVEEYLPFCDVREIGTVVRCYLQDFDIYCDVQMDSGVLAEGAFLWRFKLIDSPSASVSIDVSEYL